MLAKLAVLLSLVGGVGGSCEGAGGNLRGEIHVLLVGDPATGGRGVLAPLALSRMIWPNRSKKVWRELLQNG